MTDILSPNDSLFTKNDMIMTDNGYYANMPIVYTSAADTGGADTGGADTGAADTGGADTSAANTGGRNKSNSGDKVSDNYKNLGFPALYLYTINDTCYKQHPDNEIMADNEIMPDNEVMSDDLYNKLISLAELKPVINKKYTRNKKNINKQNIKKIKGKKTRRTKNK
jgi:hypothetical protein